MQTRFSPRSDLKFECHHLAPRQIIMYLAVAAGSNKTQTTPCLTVKVFLSAVFLEGVCLQAFLAVVFKVICFVMLFKCENTMRLGEQEAGSTSVVDCWMFCLLGSSYPDRFDTLQSGGDPAVLLQ